MTTIRALQVLNEADSSIEIDFELYQTLDSSPLLLALLTLTELETFWDFALAFLGYRIRDLREHIFNLEKYKPLIKNI